MVSSILATALLVLVARGADSSVQWTYLNGTRGPPVGDFNLLILTDLHGWLGGHRYNKNEYGQWGDKKSVSDATYGDIYSIYTNYKKQYEARGKPLYLVMNGDFYNGTGLAQNAKQLAELVAKMPFDAFSTSGQELINASETYMNFLETTLYAESLVMSNVRNASGGPLGKNYTNLGTWLVLGFLDASILVDKPDLINIQPIEEALNETWLFDAINGTAWEGVVVLCHMQRDSELVSFITANIRRLYNESHSEPEIPVILATSHQTQHDTDANCSEAYNKTCQIQAGQNLETIGFVAYQNGSFTSELVQANKEEMQKFCSPLEKKCEDPDGKDLTSAIEDARERLGLKIETGGQITHTYYASPKDDDEDLNKFFVSTVMRKVIKDEPFCLIHPRTAFRSSGYLPGKFDLIHDDVISVIKAWPENGFYVVHKNLTWDDIVDVQQNLSSEIKVWDVDEFCKDKKNLSLVTIENELSTVISVLEGQEGFDDNETRQVYKDISATSIWWEYLKSEGKKHESRGDLGFIIILFSLVGAVVLIAAALYLRKIFYRAKSPYRLVSGITNLDDDDDDEDDAMVPAYHKQAGRVELPDFGRPSSSDVTGL